MECVLDKFTCGLYVNGQNCHVISDDLHMQIIRGIDSTSRSIKKLSNIMVWHHKISLFNIGLSFIETNRKYSTMIPFIKECFSTPLWGQLYLRPRRYEFKVVMTLDNHLGL